MGLAEVAEMTEGGSTHPLFLAVLQALAAKDKSSALEMFKSSGVNLTDQLPTALRTEEQLGAQLEERSLSFLVPLLAIKADMGRQLEGESAQPEVVDKEKEMILAFKEVLQPFLTS